MSDEHKAAKPNYQNFNIEGLEYIKFGPRVQQLQPGLPKNFKPIRPSQQDYKRNTKRFVILLIITLKGQETWSLAEVLENYEPFERGWGPVETWG